MPLAHLIDFHNITRQQIETWLQQAERTHRCGNNNFLQGKTLVNLFFEPSTRTHNSFSLSAMHNGMHVLNPDLKCSALQKGETVFDTLQSFAAMGVDVMVLRHATTGFAREAVAVLQQWPELHVINAGDGMGQHPTQALSDVFTIRQALSARQAMLSQSAARLDWSQIQLSIVGDVRHSRVANSLIDVLQIMGIGQINLIAPAALLPSAEQQYAGSFVGAPGSRLQRFGDLAQGLAGSDVVVALRMQHERSVIDPQVLDDYQQNFCLNLQRLAYAKPEAILMHPGPVNFGVELSPEVMHRKNTYIFQQISNAVLMRGVLLRALLQPQYNEKLDVVTNTD